MINLLQGKQPESSALVQFLPMVFIIVVIYLAVMMSKKRKGSTTVVTHVCTTCGYRGVPERIVPGSNAVGCLLLLLLVIPGLIYAVWQQTAVYQGCPKCKGKAMIPIDTPHAQQFLGAARDERPCPACAEPILMAAKKCKHCGTELAI
jgi:predicted RNA-binding Zn-ribbon protein involved in translation (DUF1610 family)